MRRREVIALLTGIFAARPVVARAQAPAKRIGWLAFVSNPPLQSAFTKGLQQLGYVQGRDYEIENRYADGDLTRFPALADELIGVRPDVIVAGNSAAALAAKRATASIPIVVGVTFGLVASHARPEGNVTGIVGGWDTVIGKQLELGFELVPGGKTAGMLVDLGSPPAPFYRRAGERAAQAIGATIVSAEVRTPADIDDAFQALARRRVTIVIVPPDPMFLAERRRIAELAIAGQLPIVGAFREHVEGGGLMSYGIDLRENFQRAAAYVDKVIFKGAKPADLPIEQPTKFELVINLRTARAIGLTIPESFLLRADAVIE